MSGEEDEIPYEVPSKMHAYIHIVDGKFGISSQEQGIGHRCSGNN